ncbi:hypothetical protein HDU97_009331 [Phlyctochytrium planicorne]|nr:hypothetical protein HDU97_009331 [Phlyctochytrium planicorne]
MLLKIFWTSFVTLTTFISLAAGQSSCSVSGASGVCIPTNQCFVKGIEFETFSGRCQGDFDIKCCVKTSKKPAKGAQYYLDIAKANLRGPVTSIPKRLVVVDGKVQMAAAIEDGKIFKEYIISTAAKGFGNVSGSEKTPTGWLKSIGIVCSKCAKYTIIDKKAPQGMFSGSFEDTSVALMLTRLVLLDGLEESNKNAAEREIYFHGTNQVNRLGNQASHGCIRMSNDAVIDLANWIRDGDRVLVVPA